MAKLSDREQWAAQTGQPKENYPGSGGGSSSGSSELSSLNKEISSLKKQYNPGALASFGTIMKQISTTAYNQMAATQKGITDTQFDPTKVSGGTFASIIGGLEQNRGVDTSKIYASTVNDVREQQRMLGETIAQKETLAENIRQRIEQTRLEEERIAASRSRSGGGTATERARAAELATVEKYAAAMDAIMQQNGTQGFSSADPALNKDAQSAQTLSYQDYKELRLAAARDGIKGASFDDYFSGLLSEDDRLSLKKTYAQDSAEQKAADEKAAHEEEVQKIVDNIENFTYEDSSGQTRYDIPAEYKVDVLSRLKKVSK